MSETSRYDFFIAYASDDAEWVETYLIPSLQVTREKIIIEEDFRPGVEKVAEFNRGIANSRYTLLILTRAFLDGEWTMYAKSIADHLRVKQPDSLLPLILKPCNLPQELDLITPLDFTRKERWQREIERLHKCLNQAGTTSAPAISSFPKRMPFNKQGSSQYSFSTIQGKIHKLVADKKIGDAIELLRELAPPEASDLLIEILQISTSYYKLQEEENRISQEILHLLQEITNRTMKISFSPIPSKMDNIYLEENLNKYSTEPTLPSELIQKIIKFLSSLPGIHDNKQQQALIFSAGLDPQLQDQITFSGPPVQFFQLLISEFNRYGILEDGRNAIEAILESAKDYVGADRRAYCDWLIQELREVLNLEKPQ